MKEHELNRIADEVTQKVNAKAILEDHVGVRKTERVD